MKRKLAAILLVSTIVLSGCSSKGLATNKNTENSSSNSQSAISKQNETQSDNTVSGTSEEQRVQIQTNFNPVKPGSVPQLSGTQKAQLDVKLNATLKEVDNSLKTIQDAQDIDLSSVN